MIVILNGLNAGFVLNTSLQNFEEGDIAIAILFFVLSMLNIAIGYLNYKMDMKNAGR